MTATEAKKAAPAKSDAAFPHIVIRASAGTGKTFQLSNRFLGLAAAGHPPDHILATTFARKAAGEILDRVLLRLAEAADDPKKLADLKAHLQTAAALDAAQCVQILRNLIDRLHRLQISTLDSFFIQMASSFGLELGLPPGWRIVEADRRRADSPRSDPASAARTSAFRLVATRSPAGQRRGDRDRLPRRSPKSSRNCTRCFRETAATPDVWRKLPHAKELDDAGLRDALVQLESLPQLDGKRLNTAPREAIWKRRRPAIGPDSFPPAWRAADGRRANLLAATDSAGVRRRLSTAVGSRPGRARQSTRESDRRDRPAAGPHFDAAYRPLKLTRRALRFDDVTHYLAAALADGRLQDVGYRLDAGVAHLLLDEFQDTSLAQWSVLRPFAKRVTMPEQKRSLFCVGDVKQAIYGWRGGIAELLNALGSELPRSGRRRADRKLSLVAGGDRHGESRFSWFADERRAGRISAGDKRLERAVHRAYDGSHGIARPMPIAHGPRRRRPAERSKDQQIGDARIRGRDRGRNAAAENPGRTIGVLVRRNKAVARLIYELRETASFVRQPGRAAIR